MTDQSTEPRLTSLPRTTWLAPLFFALTLGLSWLIWIPLDLAHFGIAGLRFDEGASQLVRLLGVLMPAGAALALTAIFRGRAGLGGLGARLLLWRVGVRWWAAAAFAQPILTVVIALLVNRLAIGTRLVPLAGGTLGGVGATAVMLAVATLGEEIGWRGVGLPELQARLTPVTASAILGVVWSVWHVPFWLLLDTYSQYGIVYLVMNVLFIFPVTFYITWFFNHSRASLLLPVAFHVLFNLVNVAWLPVTLNLTAFWILIAAEWILAALVIRHLDPPPGKAAFQAA